MVFGDATKFKTTPVTTQQRFTGRAAMEKVGLSGKEDLTPIEMSGGEQQRLAIARAIVNRPTILIADEPTANLDEESARKIMEVFQIGRASCRESVWQYV